MGIKQKPFSLLLHFPTFPVLLPIGNQYSHLFYLSKNISYIFKHAHLLIGINQGSWLQAAEINPLDNLRRKGI